MREREREKEREREEERENKQGRGRDRERERERERIRSRLCVVSTEPNAGLKLTNCQDHDLSRNQESEAKLTLNWLNYPGPPFVFLKIAIPTGMKGYPVVSFAFP